MLSGSFARTSISISLIGISPVRFNSIVLFGSDCKRDMKSATALVLLGKSATTMLNAVTLHVAQ